jgi:hypothetical protein
MCGYRKIERAEAESAAVAAVIPSGVPVSWARTVHKAGLRQYGRCRAREARLARLISPRKRPLPLHDSYAHRDI